MRKIRLWRMVSACMAVMMVFSNPVLLHAANVTVGDEVEVEKYASYNDRIELVTLPDDDLAEDQENDTLGKDIAGIEKLTDNLLKELELTKDDRLINIRITLRWHKDKDPFLEEFIQDERYVGYWDPLKTLSFQASKEEIYTYAASEYVLEINGNRYFPEENVANYADDILEEERERVLCEDYLEFTGNNLSFPEEVLIRYYGTYNGCEVVIMSMEGAADTAAIRELVIGDYVFYFGMGSMSKRFYVHKDNTFIPVIDAYESGVLTDKDMEQIADNYGADLLSDRIKEDYLEQLKNKADSIYQNLTVDDIELYGFYQVSDTSVICCSRLPEMESEPKTVTIGGHEFFFPGGSYGSSSDFLYWENRIVWTVKDAFNNKMISQEELDAYCESEGCAPFGYGEMDELEQKKLEIKKDYQNWVGEEYAKLEDISCYYYGNYNGMDIVQIYDLSPGPDVGYDLQLGKYVFGYGNQGDALKLYAYKDNAFIWIRDAYASNLLTDNDIHSLAMADKTPANIYTLDNELMLNDYVEGNLLSSYRAKLKKAGIEATNIQYECYGIFGSSDLFDHEVVLFDYAEADDDNEYTEIEIGEYTFSFISKALSERLYYNSEDGWMSVKEAYEDGLLTDANVEHIAGKMNRSKFGIAAYKKADLMDGQLPPLQEKELREDFVSYFNITHKEPDKIVYQNYGLFEDYMVVWISEFSNMGTDDCVDIQLGDYIFSFGSGSSAKRLFVYKDDSFIPVKEAYDQGILTDDVVEIVAKDFDIPGYGGVSAYNPKEKLSLQIRTEFAEFMGGNLTADDIEEPYVWGDYNGLKIISVDTKKGDDFIGIEIGHDAYIGGYLFSFGWIYDYLELWCWEPGRFLRLEEAYEEGLLSQVDIYEFGRKQGSLVGPEILPYKDVDAENDWFGYYVYNTYIRQLMHGLDTETFGPYELLSRAQFTTILSRMEGDAVIETEKTFDDIIGDEWYADAVLWAAENDIVNGYENGCFGPADSITREQLAVMLYRYAHYKGYVGDFSVFVDKNSEEWLSLSDTEDVSDFAVHAMKWVVENGIISGNDGRLLPQGNATRAECAVMICRFSEKFE